MENELFIRITPHSPTSFDDMRDTLRHLSIETYCVSFEQASRDHYHAYVRTTRSPENLRYNLKRFLNAQIYISGKQVIDKVRTIAYTIKDGSFIHNNIDINTMLMAQAVSHPKITFDDRIAEIRSTDPHYITTKVVDAYIEFDRKPYRQHIEALVGYILLKQDPSYRTRYIRSIADNFIDYH